LVVHESTAFVGWVKPVQILLGFSAAADQHNLRELQYVIVETGFKPILSKLALKNKTSWCKVS
jgi:hypothetical protein